MPRIKIDAVEWDDANELHATDTASRLVRSRPVLTQAAVAYRNRQHRSGDYFVRGSTSGGRTIKVVFGYNRDT